MHLLGQKIPESPLGTFGFIQSNPLILPERQLRHREVIMPVQDQSASNQNLHCLSLMFWVLYHTVLILVWDYFRALHLSDLTPDCDVHPSESLPSAYTLVSMSKVLFSFQTPGKPSLSRTSLTKQLFADFPGLVLNAWSVIGPCAHHYIAPPLTD